jgi:hypothetical protein
VEEDFSKVLQAQQSNANTGEAENGEYVGQI